MKYEKIAHYTESLFSRVTGVKRSTFKKMIEILAAAERKKSKGRTP
jgi:hypothetical protein